MFQFKKILTPLDGSEFAETALEPALAIARSMAAEVVLFRVAEAIPRTHELIKVPDLYNDFVISAYREAGHYLKHLRARLRYDKISVRSRAASGGAARQIVDYAANNGVDLIVMSSHGRSGVDRWVHGSVTEKVLSGVSCAILIIRSQ